jgi:hypothetical protein
MCTASSTLADELFATANGIEYLPGFQVREKATGVVRVIGAYEMQALLYVADKRFDVDTYSRTTCCGGAVQEWGGCSRYPGRECIYVGQARAILREVSE